MMYGTVRPGNQALLAVVVCACWLTAGAGAALATPARPPHERSARVAAARLALPAPTGPWAIGVRSGFVADPTRVDPTTGKPRTLPIRVWYPARHAAAGRPAPYFSAAIERVVEDAFNLPSGLFAVDTHATADAPMRRHIKGVILVSPGQGEPVALLTGQVIELASRGWVLVTFDHPHETFVVEQPDGTLIFGDPDRSPQTAEADVERRVLDVGVVLGQLPTLLGGRAHALPVGMFGFSLGGTTAAEALLRYPRLRAAVDLDGRALGRVVQEGLDQPLGIMVDRHGLDQVPLLALLVSRLRGPHPIHQLDVEHHGFTDFVVFNPEATLADPALGVWLETTYATGIPTLDAGTAALSAQRRFLTNFMDRYLTHCHHHDHARALRNAATVRLAHAPLPVHAAPHSRCGH